MKLLISKKYFCKDLKNCDDFMCQKRQAKMKSNGEKGGKKIPLLINSAYSSTTETAEMQNLSKLKAPKSRSY